MGYEGNTGENGGVGVKDGLDTACRQLAAWKAAGIAGLTMAVNLSARQLRAPALVALVRDTLARHGLGEGELELEITESVAMADPERAIDLLRNLRALGVRLAIDDFGTGYSSLAYLKHLPIHALKLDRSFVREIETDPNNAAISAATIALAKNLGLEVVTEGVETEAQANFLGKTHQCDLLQGYLFGKPEPAEVLTDRLLSQAMR
jgi:EAL domain-containing protein (putative c-di-GMP-specific phosphodiesterase class I)